MLMSTSTSFRSALLILTLAPLGGNLTGCLAPIPLEPQVVADGGMILQMFTGDPDFGKLDALSTGETFRFQIDVVSDSASLAGRIYTQINGTCCQLNVQDYNVTRFQQNADVIPAASNTGAYGHYTVDFRQPMQPCTLVAPGGTAYLIPVLASQGFREQPTGDVPLPDGLGIVDRSHSWSVKCP